MFLYDNGGNILLKKEYDYTTEEITIPNSVEHDYEYSDDHWGDLLMAYKGQNITYDGIGNPLNDGTRTYTWVNGRQLASMTSGTTTWSYKYNADGLRTEKTNGTITFDYIYSGSQLIQMTVGNKVFYFTYDAAGTPMTVTYSGTKYFYATNLQGDIIAILDTNGNAVVEYTYDAWGNPLSTTGTMTTLGLLNPLRYRGYVYDSDIGLYYLQSRYYDPELGRFINADAYASTGQGVLGNNMFAYCLNNPVVLADSSGTAAHIGFSADGQIHDAPWRIGSPGGGGWSQDIHYSQQDYGSVAEKFYTVRAAKFVGNRIAHSAHKLWDSYVYSVERTSDLCLQQNITMQLFAHDLFSSPQRVVAFDGVVSYTITASGMFACGITGTPVALIGTAVVSPAVGVVLGAVGIVSGLLQIKWYFEDIHDPRR